MDDFLIILGETLMFILILLEGAVEYNYVRSCTYLYCKLSYTDFFSLIGHSFEVNLVKGANKVKHYTWTNGAGLKY